MRNGQHYAYPNPSNATPGGMTYRQYLIAKNCTSYDHELLQQRCLDGLRRPRQNSDDGCGCHHRS